VRIGIVLSLIFSLLPIPSFGQENTNVFYIESWKRGEQKIQEQKLTVELNQSNLEYERTLNDSIGQPRYILQIRHWPLKKGSYLYESWWVDLCEFRKPNRKPKFSSDCKLMSEEGRGVGDNFPKGDFIGWLYPLENPKFFLDGVAAYPIMAKRVIKVDGFFCIIQVTDYKMSKSNPKAVDTLTLEIEFRNTYDIPKQPPPNNSFNRSAR
jgi:hypothetical protein